MQGRAPCMWTMAASRIRRLYRTEGGLGTREAAHRRHRPLPTAGPGSQFPSLTMGAGTISLVAARRSRRDGVGVENNCKEDCEDLRRRRTQGRLQGARGGFSPSGFPPSRSGHCPTHAVTVIPTAGGVASAAEAAPRIEAAGGSLSQSLGGTSTYTGILRIRCATLSQIA